MLRKIQRARGRCVGAHTTRASVMPRCRSSGRVRDAFCAVFSAVSSTTTSISAGPRQRSRMNGASPAQPLKTTALGDVVRAIRCAASTSLAHARGLLLPRTTRAPDTLLGYGVERRKPPEGRGLSVLESRYGFRKVLRKSREYAVSVR